MGDKFMEGMKATFLAIIAGSTLYMAIVLYNAIELLQELRAIAMGGMVP